MARPRRRAGGVRDRQSRLAALLPVCEGVAVLVERPSPILRSTTGVRSSGAPDQAFDGARTGESTGRLSAFPCARPSRPPRSVASRGVDAFGPSAGRADLARPDRLHQMSAMPAGAPAGWAGSGARSHRRRLPVRRRPGSPSLRFATRHWPCSHGGSMPSSTACSRFRRAA